MALIPITWLAERRCISGARIKVSKVATKSAEIRLARSVIATFALYHLSNLDSLFQFFALVECSFYRRVEGTVMHSTELLLGSCLF